MIEGFFIFADYKVNVDAIKALFAKNPDNFKVAKYFVRSLANFSKDSFVMDGKRAFMWFREAEKINDDILIGKHKYDKLKIKLLLTKIKQYDMFYKPE